MSSTPSEKGCLSDSRRRPRPNELGDLLDQLLRSSKLQNEKLKTLLDRRKEQILAEWQVETKKHEFQADCYRRKNEK